jgi:hypothetical protein
MICGVAVNWAMSSLVCDTGTDRGFEMASDSRVDSIEIPSQRFITLTTTRALRDASIPAVRTWRRGVERLDPRAR